MNQSAAEQLSTIQKSSIQMPLAQRRDILATLTFAQVVKIVLPLTKIIKIKFMGAFLILVIEKFSSREHSTFLTFLLIPAFCKIVCLKQDYFL